MELPSIDQLKQRAGRLLKKAVIKPVQDYFQPTGQVRTRDIVRELPSQFTPRQMGQNLMDAPKFNIGANSESGTKKFVGGVASGMLNPLLSVRDYAKEASSQYYGVSPSNNKKLVGSGGQAILDLASVFPIGQGVKYGKEALKQVVSRSPSLVKTIVQGARSGAKVGFGFGTGYGVTGAMQEDASVPEIIKQGAKGGAMGAVIGGGLGGGIPAVSGATKALVHDVRVKFGKSYGKADSLPARDVLNSTDYYERGKPTSYSPTELPAQTFDPNAPILPGTMRQINEAMPRFGMNVQDVSGGKQNPLTKAGTYKVIYKFGDNPIEVTPKFEGKIAGHDVFVADGEFGGAVLYDKRTGLMVGSSKYKNGKRAFEDGKNTLISQAKDETELSKAFEVGHARNPDINNTQGAIPQPTQGAISQPREALSYSDRRVFDGASAEKYSVSGEKLNGVEYAKKLKDEGFVVISEKRGASIGYKAVKGDSKINITGNVAKYSYILYQKKKAPVSAGLNPLTKAGSAQEAVSKRMTGDDFVKGQQSNITKDSQFYQEKIDAIKAKPKSFGINNKAIIDLYQTKLENVKASELQKIKDITYSPVYTKEEVLSIKNAKSSDDIWNIVKTKGPDTKGMWTTRLQTIFPKERITSPTTSQLRAEPQAAKGAGTSEVIPPQFDPKTTPIAPEPSIQDFPLLSARTKIAGVNDAPVSAIRTMQDLNRKATLPDGSPMLGDVPRTALPSGEPTSSLSSIEKSLFGNEAFTPQAGGKEGAGIIGNQMRKIETGFDSLASDALGSPNPIIRGLATTLRGFFGGLGKSQGLITNLRESKGAMDYSADLTKQFDNLIPKDKVLRGKLHSHLDPEQYGGVKAPLTEQEAGQLELLKKVSDYINDTNYKNGFLTQPQWANGRGGRYIARMYDDFELPKEIQKFYGGMKAKLDLNPFKKRDVLDEWKIDHSIRDPVYLIGKRLEQTMFNDSTKKLFDSLITTHREVVSDVARPGFVQISENKVYGALSGKFVRKDVMEDIQGYFSTNKFFDGIHDILKAYDGNPIIQFYKKLLTVLNPVTHVGNGVGNVNFANLNGLNPVVFTKEFTIAAKELSTNSPMVLRLKRDGVLGSTVHRGELQPIIDEMKVGITDKNILLRIDEEATKLYRGTDDAAKLAAVKMWMQKGYSYAEATKRTMDGFQNYYTVGFFYNIASKIPILGNPFVKFSGSLMIIIKNSMRDHPIRAAATLYAIDKIGDVSSRLSGETEEDKNTRENRVGASKIPFTNTSLEFQTPVGAVNAARMFGLAAQNQPNGESGSFNRFLPLKKPTPKNFSDPVLGPFAQLYADTDFRGKSIKDPAQTKYKPSTLTDSEQRWNQAKFLGRAVTGPFVNSLSDVKSSLMGEPDYYGRVRSPKQAVSSALGVKIEDFGPGQAQERRDKDAQFDQYKREDIKKSVSSVTKDELLGKITPEKARERIAELTSGLSDSSAQSSNAGIKKNYLGKYQYIDDNGDLKTADTMEKAELALEKIDFASSDDTFRKFQGKVFRKNEDGEVMPTISQEKYDSQLLSAKLTQSQDNEDYNGWFVNAKSLYQNLEAQVSNPNIDEETRISIENQIYDLVKKAAKFKKYGGFSKPRAPKKRKAIKFKTSPYKISTAVSKPKTISSPKFKLPPEPVFKVGAGYKVK